MAEHREPTAPSVDTLTWALCPIFLACEDCDMPQIMNGPRPECRQCPGPDETGSQAGCRIPAEIAARIALGLLEPPTGRVELGERSNTESSPTTAATRWQATLEAEKAAILDFVVDGKIGDPSPPAVVDHTERDKIARALHKAHMPHCVRSYPFEDDRSGRWIYEELADAALSAVASERDAEIASMRSLLDTVYECERSLIAERDAATAKLARLREPEMRKTLQAALHEEHGQANWSAAECDFCERLAEAALAVITEKLT